MNAEPQRCDEPFKALNGVLLCRCELPRNHRGPHYGVAPKSGTRCQWQYDEPPPERRPPASR